ncbi:hypothetical protein QJQ45_000794 [Haematococcus lacustris]|nr:hypothetical protein QJQ45_000794 [Haematococcus lacustris]
MAKKKRKGSDKKQKERIVKLFAKAARAKLGWSGEEAQLFIRMACGYGINAKSSELNSATMDKGHGSRHATTSCSDALFGTPCLGTGGTAPGAASLKPGAWPASAGPDVVPCSGPPQAPRSSQEATPTAASEPGPSTPQPAKRSKRTKAEPAAEPTKGKGKGKAAKAKPAPQQGRWLDRDCNAALNMQRIGESRWRPLELCYWPDQGALPAKGKEYPGLGYKRLREQPPKAQQQQQQPAVAQ